MRQLYLLRPQRNPRTNHALQGTNRTTPNWIRLVTSIDGVQYLELPMRSAPEVREALVEQVRRAIEMGIYSVEIEQIAERMINATATDRIF